jgi:hypothetical protein
MANRFVGGILSSKQPVSGGFVSRASTGTYFDSTGVLRTAPINQPRLNYSYVNGAWTQPTVLIEPASTNQCVYSIPTTVGGAWTSSQGTLTANSALAPDGTATATLLTEDGTSSSFHVAYTSGGNIMTPSAGVYTCSIFAKAGTRNNVFLQWCGDNAGTRVAVNFNLTTGAVGTNIGTMGSPTQYGWSSTPVGNGWWRLSVYAYQTTNTLYIVVGTAINDSAAIVGGSAAYFTGGTGGTVYFWGAQQELGRTATSYIPTTGTAVTRAQDDVGPLGSGVYNLNNLQNQTAIDDQATVQSFTITGSSTWTCPVDVTSVEVLVVAGGGGANNSSGGNSTGGGGGGGVVYNTNYTVTPGTTYPIIVGAGGAPAASNSFNPSNGGNSQFGNLIAIGGGWGKGRDTTGSSGGNGGSGGGGDTYGNVGGRGISGQGYSGGNGVNFVASTSGGGGGGGGAAGPGGNAIVQAGGVNGPGLGLTISGSLVYYGAGGVGQSSGGSNTTAVAGGTASNTNGAANTGAGGAGGTTNNGTSTGGSGIVIVKYRRTSSQISSVSNAAVVTQKFSVSNTWTAPAGVTQIETLVVGGGGGGAELSGGGGAGGVVYNSALSVTPGASYTMIVGNGGTGVTSATASFGYSGGDSAVGGSTELNPNYSFSSTSGWTSQISATTTVFSTAGGPTNNANGVIALSSAGGSNIYQSYLVSGLTNGTQYTLSFWLRGSSAFTLSVLSFTDGIHNTGTALRPQTSFTLPTVWTQYSYVFTANSANQIYLGFFTGGNAANFCYISQLSVRQSVIGALGGGGGGGFGTAGQAGGSGGGAGRQNATGGSATQPGSTSGGFGNAGGFAPAGASGNSNIGAGGGGAGSAGFNSIDSLPSGGNGGSGLPFGITGNLEYYAGGGGGGSYNASPIYPGKGGIGGGGYGAQGNGTAAVNGLNGAPNTGGGGGGGGGNGGVGGTGGSGVIVIRYRAPTVATFLDSGSWTCPSGVTSVQALIVAGGGGGGATPNGSSGGGGGGAGGLLYSSSVAVTPGTTYSVVVGQGGSGGTQVTGFFVGGDGASSSFANITAYGGGGGGQANNNPLAVGRSGGSGGGGGATYGGTQFSPGPLGGAGVYGQGNSGGTAYNGADVPGQGSGGGGGAGQSGGSGATLYTAGRGGNGLAFSISGSSVTYAGGGGGGMWAYATPGGAGGTGGGGGGSSFNNSTLGSPGTQNTGAGGGGGGTGSPSPTNQYSLGYAGGSGIVIIRYYGG